MSVVEKLRSFRYKAADGLSTAGTPPRELPWRVVRSVNVANLKTEEPDLQLMKNLLSMLASFTIASSTVSGASDTDLLQLLLLMQASLQFALHSQNVLRGELVERQNTEAVQKVSAKYIERADAKLAVLAEENRALREERDTLKLSADSLSRLLAQQQASAETLERQLERERARLYEVVTHHERLPSHPTPAHAVAPLPVVHDQPERALGSERSRARREQKRGAAPREETATGPRRRTTRRSSGPPGTGESIRSSASVASEMTETGTDAELRELRTRHSAVRRTSRERAHAGPGRGESPGPYVDWHTFAHAMESLQGHGRRRSRSGPSDPPLPTEELRRTSKEVIPVDTLMETKGGTTATVASDAQPVAEAVRATITAAVEALQQDLRQQVSSVVQHVDRTTGRLVADLARLRESHELLAATVSRGGRVDTAPTSSTPPAHAARQPPAEGAAGAAELPKPPAASGSPAQTRMSWSSLPEPQRPPSTHVEAPVYLPGPAPQQQESVTPLAASLPASLVVDETSPREPKPLTALEGSHHLAATALATAPASTANVDTTPTAGAAAGARAPHESKTSSPTAVPSPASTGPALAVRETDAGSGRGSDRGSPRPAPSPLSSALSIRSRRSLPTFDVSSALRSPLKSGEGRKFGGETGFGQGSQPAAATSEKPGRVESVSLGSTRRWGSDIPHDDLPISAATRAAMAAGSPGSDSSSLLFAPRSTLSTSGGDASGAQDDPRPDLAEDVKRCQHCHQRIPTAALRAHEEGCDMRLIPCAACGRRVVARLMPKHQCKLDPTAPDGPRSPITTGATESGGLAKRAEESESRPLSGVGGFHAAAAVAGAEPTGKDSRDHSPVSSLAGSQGPKRESSVLLQEAQRELQSLMKEEEAYQRAVKKAS